MLPTAAAYEHPERVGVRAGAYFADLGATVRTLPVLHRAEAEDPEIADVVRAAKFVYVADGSPLHLRSVLKGSALFEAILASYQAGGVLAASGAGATLLCDPMVDPPRRRVHRRPRRREGPRGVPVPRHRRDPPP